MTWHANIAIKSNDKIDEAQWDSIKKWAEVDAIWSTTGQWDWWVKLKPSKDSLDEAEKIAWKLREQPWVATTQTWWAKAV